MEMMSLTHQRSALGKGLAVGMLLNGVGVVSCSKTDLEYGFRRAWRVWPEARQFPGINAGPQRDDIWLQVIARSERRMGTVVAAWNSDGPGYRPYIAIEAWTLNDAAEHLEESHGIGRSQWMDLAATMHAQISH